MITPSSKEGTVCRGWELYNRAYLPSQGTHSDDGPSVHPFQRWGRFNTDPTSPAVGRIACARSARAVMGECHGRINPAGTTRTAQD